MKAEKIEILLVEDNPSDAKLCKMALQSLNLPIKIVHLRDGQEALDYLFPGGEINGLPSLILLDLQMPRVNGMEVLKKLKSNDETRGIPVTVFTTSEEDKEVKECYRLGANSYVVKPLDFDRFTEVVKNLQTYWLSTNHLPD